MSHTRRVHGTRSVLNLTENSFIYTGKEGDMHNIHAHIYFHRISHLKIVKTNVEVLEKRVNIIVLSSVRHNISNLRYKITSLRKYTSRNRHIRTVSKDKTARHIPLK